MHVSKWLVQFETIVTSASITDPKGKTTAISEAELPGPIFVYRSVHLRPVLECIGRQEKALLAKDRPKSEKAAKELLQRLLSGKDTATAESCATDLAKAVAPEKPADRYDVAKYGLTYVLANVQTDFTRLPDNGELARNNIEMRTVLDSNVYLLNYRSPLVGSVDGKVTLSEDGLLTAAEGKMTDNTASTLLSLLPINAALTSAWGLQAKTSSTSTKGTSGAPSLDGPPAEVIVRPYVLTVTLTPVSSTKMVTLQKACTKASPCDSAEAVRVLTLSDARGGLNGVELAAIESYPPKAPDDKGNTNSDNSGDKPATDTAGKKGRGAQQ